MHNTQKELDPYWQKLEWLKIKQDNPNFCSQRFIDYINRKED